MLQGGGSWFGCKCFRGVEAGLVVNASGGGSWFGCECFRGVEAGLVVNASGGWKLVWL